MAFSSTDDPVHRSDDGRGKRRVLVNGNEISNVLLADTRRGVVVYAPTPIRAKRGSDVVYTRELHGTVQVIPMEP